MSNYTVFQHLLKPITKKLISDCTQRFQSDRYCETLNTYDHLRAMVYAHLTDIKSLRTLEAAINSQKIGFQHPVRRSTLSDANSRRPAACFFWLLEHLMSLLPRKYKKDMGRFIKILDSSPIQLKDNGYEWAKEFATQRCQGLKLHVEYDLVLTSPTRCETSHANYNDISMSKDWPIETNTIYIFDKGYCDFNWWWKIHKKQSFFITRLKKKTAIDIKKKQENISSIILEENIFTFKNKSPRGGKINLYQDPLRRISVKREGKHPMILVTNIQDMSAEKIAELYKARWDIELFFKWVKQNLKLKKFLGKSVNAVKIQIASALIAFLLIQLLKHASADNRKLQLILVCVKYNLAATQRIFRSHSPPIHSFSHSTFFNTKRAV